MYFRSRDKDGGHTILSTTATTTMLHANFKFVTLSATEVRLLLSEVLHCENMKSRVFLLLWPWPWLSYMKQNISPKDVKTNHKWTLYIKAFESHYITDRYKAIRIITMQSTMKYRRMAQSLWLHVSISMYIHALMRYSACMKMTYISWRCKNKPKMNFLRKKRIGESRSKSTQSKCFLFHGLSLPEISQQTIRNL